MSRHAKLVFGTITAYAVTAVLLFAGLRAWGGGAAGSRWSATVWAPEFPSRTHHFFPHSAKDIALALALLGLASLAALALDWQRTRRLVMGAWSIASLILGVMILAISHLQVIAIEPGGSAIGHVIPPVAAAFLLPVGAALALMAVVDHKTWAPMFLAGLIAMSIAIALYGALQLAGVGASVENGPVFEAIFFVAPALVGLVALSLWMRKRPARSGRKT